MISPLAYVTAQDRDRRSEFGYRTKQREIVKTAGASIGLARTELVLDASGAYRASVLLKVDNRTEPYLEIELPPDAVLVDRACRHAAGEAGPCDWTRPTTVSCAFR